MDSTMVRMGRSTPRWPMVEKTNPSGTEPHIRATAKTLNRMRESPAMQAMTSDITGNHRDNATTQPPVR